MTRWYPRVKYHENINCDPEVWDEVVDFIVEKGFNSCVIEVADGIVYDSHPEIAAPDAWSKELLKEKLAKELIKYIFNKNTKSPEQQGNPLAIAWEIFWLPRIDKIKIKTII